MQIYEKLKKVLKNPKIKFEIGFVSDGDLGETDRTTVVRIDARNLITETLVHELFHVMHPNWKEKWIDRKSAKAYGRLSQDQRKKLYVMFINRLKQKKYLEEEE